MKNRVPLLVSLGVALAFTGAKPGSAQSLPQDYQEVLSILGKQGDYKDKVLKVNFPRNDLKNTVAGMPMPTAFGFGGWIALTKGDHDLEHRRECGHRR